MGNSKVIFGNETLIDLTGDTVTPDTLLAGTTAHNRSGEQIVGTATVPEELDDLTDVTLTSPAEGDLLQYDATGQKWVNSAAVPNALAAVRDNGAVNKAGAVTIQTQAVSGLTITRNSDDTVTISGVYGGANRLDLDYVDRHTFALGAGTYRLTGCPSRYSNVELIMQVDGLWAKTGQTDYGNGCTFTATTSVNALAIRIQPGADFSTPATFKPMISDAALNLSYSDYQPYSETNPVLTQKVAGLQKTGCVNTLEITMINHVVSGITFTVSSDGISTVGTNASSQYDVGELVGNYAPPVSGTYKLLGCPSGGSATTYWLEIIDDTTNVNLGSDTGNGLIVTLDATHSYRVRIKIGKSLPAPSGMWKPMVTGDLSATYDDYQPYSMTNRELTDEIDALKLLNSKCKISTGTISETGRLKIQLNYYYNAFIIAYNTMFIVLRGNVQKINANGAIDLTYDSSNDWYTAPALGQGYQVMIFSFVNSNASISEF